MRDLIGISGITYTLLTALFKKKGEIKDETFFKVTVEK